MKEFHRNYVLRPTELEKKGRRGKNELKEICKCFAPFVRLHYYDCPAVKKSCPIHGNNHHHGVRGEKGEPKNNVIISFHPSSKTERLFQPVKTLLAQCKPETKVNFQYYSPKSTTSKESLNHHQTQVQTKPEDGKRALNNSVFVEKTKSFVADKTNKMKKLKQCFHSPCNSIAHNSRSQTSVKEKFQGIFREERKKINDVGNRVPDKPPDDLKYDSNLTWFSNRFDVKNWEKLSAKTDSDFITVTQQAKNNFINHKIFEIKHKKGLNDYPFVRLPEQASQLVYSSLDVDRPFKKTQDPQEKKGYFENSPPSEGSRGNESKQRRDEELSSSENLQTSSSSSVYFTPFIFVPAVASSESGSKSKSWEDEAVQVGSKEHGDGIKEALAQETQTPSLQSEREFVSQIEESKTASVLLQTDLERQSGDSANQEWYLRPLEVAESFTTRGTQTDESLFRLDKSVGDSRRLSELSSEIFAPASGNEACDFHVQGTQTSGSPTDIEAPRSSESTEVRTVEVQTSKCRRKAGILNTTTWTMTTLDKVVQTESCKVLEVQRLWSFKVNRSQMAAPKLSNKTTQTIFTQSESLEEVSEFIDLDSSNVTFVVKPFGNEESDQAIDKLAKAWWGKSHSDSQLYGSRRCNCVKPEYVIPLSRGCSCNQSETTRDSATPAKYDQKTTVSHLSSNEKGSSKNTKIFKPESKADKSLGTDDGSQRLYRRAEKALGTDSGMDVPPEMLGKADKALGTDSGILRMSKRVDKALGTESEVRVVPGTSRRSEGATGNKADRSPRKLKYSSKAEQTSLNEECPSPLSDLSELTKIIQEFFEKTGKTSWRTCPCETSEVPAKKIDRTATTDSRRAKKEYVDRAVGAHTINEKRVDSEAVTDAPEKPKGEFTNAETQVSSTTKEGPAADSSGNRPHTDRIKIRRSVLLDETETKIRFICSVCAREISTFSMNAATNTENVQNSSQKKEKIKSVSTEISELVRVKSVRTIQSFDNPKRLTSAPEPSARVHTSDANEGTSALTFRPFRESLRNTSKSYIPTPRPGTGVTSSDRTQQPVKRDPVKRTATSAKAATFAKGCICDHEDEICTKDSCPNRGLNPNVPTTSRVAPPRTDIHPSLPRADHPGMPSSQSRNNRRSAERNRTQRRTLEPYYPVLIKSPWPRDFTWNISEKSQSNVPEDWESATLQQKRSYERETEPAEGPAGKKIKPESEKPSGQYFMFGSATSQDLRMGDRILFPNKAGFILIPSLSTSSVDPPKKHALSQSKVIKSEESVREANQRHGVVPPEGLNDPPDLSSTKSCRLTPIRLECDDKLFECRVCKSLTFMKTDRDGVVFHWRHGLLTCRPTVMQYQNPTAGHIRRDDSESLHQNESSTQNFDEFFEESSHFSERSDSPSPYELLPEEAGETTEEEPDPSPQRPELKRQRNEAAPTLSDLFYSNAATSSKSFNKFWSEGYTKKE